MDSSWASPEALPRPGSWRTTLAQAIRRRTEWLRAARRDRRGIHELVALDDRSLADIGLTRSDVEHAARYGRLPAAANARDDADKPSR